MKTATRSSQALNRRGLGVLAGGVNSPVRAFGAVGGTPRYVTEGKGARLTDADGNSLLDYVCCWGSAILGHANPAVVERVQKAAAAGSGFGAPHPDEVALGELVRRHFPSMERMRMVSSGTEATMSAIRLARAATGRELVLKFDGCYHGHSDGLLVQAGSGAATLGIAASPGVPAPIAACTISAAYNDLEAVRQAFALRGGEIAAVIVEPVACNMGVVPPATGFLAGLRELTAAAGSLLIFDEVITGLRVGPGGAQQLYGVRPDLTCLGKILGGGLPIGAYGGPADLMSQVAPEGSVYQAGTLAGNPVVMASGLATLAQLDKGLYRHLETLGNRLEAGLSHALNYARVEGSVARVGSLLTLFFARGPIENYAEARRADTSLYGRFFHQMLEHGVNLPPSQFEAWFISAAHSEADIDRTVEIAADALQSLHA